MKRHWTFQSYKCQLQITTVTCVSVGCPNQRDLYFNKHMHVKAAEYAMVACTFSDQCNTAQGTGSLCMNQPGSPQGSGVILVTGFLSEWGTSNLHWSEFVTQILFVHIQALHPAHKQCALWCLSDKLFPLFTTLRIEVRHHCCDPRCLVHPHIYAQCTQTDTHTAG